MKYPSAFKAEGEQSTIVEWIKSSVQNSGKVIKYNDRHLKEDGWYNSRNNQNKQAGQNNRLYNTDDYSSEKF